MKSISAGLPKPIKEKPLTFKDLVLALEKFPSLLTIDYLKEDETRTTEEIFEQFINDVKDWKDDFEGLVGKLQKQLREFSRAPVNTNPKLMNWVILNLTCKKGRIVRAEAIRKFIKKRILGDSP